VKEKWGRVKPSLAWYSATTSTSGTRPGPTTTSTRKRTADNGDEDGPARKRGL